MNNSLKPNEKHASLAVNAKGDKVIKITFPYDMDLLFKVRNIPGREYHPQDKCWSAPLHKENLRQLQEIGFTLDQKLLDLLHISEVKQAQLIVEGITGFKGNLYPFQSVGVSFIEQRKGRVLIADDMGLGKTIQAIAWLQMHPELRPAVIVCPAFLKLNWQNECHKFLSDPETVILSGTTSKHIKGKIIIINYDILKDWTEEILKCNPKVIITDECQYYKSNKAVRTKAVKHIAKYIPNFIALSGTPVENRPAEIYNAVDIIDHTLFPKRWLFLQRYCNPRYNGFGWDFSGYSNIPELHRILTSTIMIRRKKQDVLKDLPPKVWSYIPMELSNEREYQLAENDFIHWVKINKGLAAAERAANTVALSSIEALKQLAVKGKLTQAGDWIEAFLESGRKLVVFSGHHFTIDELKKRFAGVSVVVDGRVSLTDRQKAVDQFQSNPTVKLFIGNIDAAGVGLTLTAASDVAFIELPWTPGKLVQAEDRVHRIGQANSVTVYFLLANNTIEQEIAKLLDHKRKVVDAILDGRDTESKSLLSELMKSYE